MGLPKTDKVPTTLTKAVDRTAASDSATTGPAPRKLPTEKKEKKTEAKKEAEEKAEESAAVAHMTKEIAERKTQNSERAQLHGVLNKYYTELDGCPDEECRESMQKKIDSVEEQLKSLSHTRKKILSTERSRHLRRAELHERLEGLYTQAANCATRVCRVRTRKALQQYQKALRKLNRNMLGAKKMNGEVTKGITSNHFVHELKLALNNCRVGDADTESRDRAVIEHLQELVARKVKEDIDACVDSPGS